jgi:hypothetical protein
MQRELPLDNPDDIFLDGPEDDPVPCPVCESPMQRVDDRWICPDCSGDFNHGA